MVFTALPLGDQDCFLSLAASMMAIHNIDMAPAMI
jgi:hypothetical protein